MVRLGKFEGNIVGRHERADGYVVLKHEEHYTIELINHYRNRRANAIIKVDGKDIGTWRLPVNGRVVIERPANEQRLLTFFLDGTSESRQAGISAGDSQNGHIAITFVAEKKPNVRRISLLRAKADYREEEEESEMCFFSTNSLGSGSRSRSLSARESYGMPATATASSTSSFVSGASGLSGHSSQRFNTADHITQDISTTTVIHLRLVGETGSHIRPLQDIYLKPPLSNAIPVPVRVQGNFIPAHGTAF